MKNTCFFAVLLAVMGVWTAPAFGACAFFTTSACNTTDDKILSVHGMGGCYICGVGGCINGSIVSILGNADIMNDGKGFYKDNYFTCKAGTFDPEWEVEGKIEDCPSTARLKGKTGVVRWLAISDGSATEGKTGVSTAVSSKACIAYGCKNGVFYEGECRQTPDVCKLSNGTLAVKEYTYDDKCSNKNGKLANGLTSSAHLKSDAMCRFKCTANGWVVTLRDDSCQQMYKPNSARKECVKTQEAIEQENQQRQERQERDRRNEANRKKNDCEKSGGTWSGGKCECSADKGLTKSGSVCTCLGGYEWNADKRQGCKKTDVTKLRELCAQEPNATWNDVLGQCVCDKNSMTPMTHEFNVTAGKCQEKAWYADCKVLIAQGKARITKQQTCECTQSGYVYQDGECVETAEAAAQRIQDTAKRKVDTAYAALKVIHDKFRGDVSVWKDEEGNFNTARLASDSVAAVVLGTAGGLITSNVVKKNQVESGFEDIKCTIGGQNVAQWGDQFRVGIQ